MYIGHSRTSATCIHRANLDARTGNGTPTVTKENDVVIQLEMQFEIQK